jgi:hypothetical protein
LFGVNWADGGFNVASHYLVPGDQPCILFLHIFWVGVLSSSESVYLP